MPTSPCLLQDADVAVDCVQSSSGWETEYPAQASGKRPRVRVHWSSEMHGQFVGAVNRLGIDKAVPKKILELMDVEGLTRENVASHLQKYRLYLKKTSKLDDGVNRPFDQVRLIVCVSVTQCESHCVTVCFSLKQCDAIYCGKA